MAERDTDPREYEPILEDEREVPIDDEVETELPPPTIDAEERRERDEDSVEVPLDDERPA